jgi:DNA replication protein DnaC
MSDSRVPAVPIDEVIALCRRLRLKYVREQVEEVVLTARAQRWDPTDVLRALLVAEATGRDHSTIETRRRRAHFPAGKTFDTWTEARSSIPAKTQRSLRSLEWVTRSENLVVAGPSGTGKSHLLEALGHAAVDAQMTVAWFSVEDLGAVVRRHRVDDTVSKAFASLASVLGRRRRHRAPPHLERRRRGSLPAGRRQLRAALGGPVVEPAPIWF